jgi:hypothetical protein
MKKIDVCLNVLGKPYQTIVTLKSLLKYSSQHIDKIYLIEELKQPEDYSFNLIKKELNYDNLIKFIPKNHLWINFTNPNLIDNIDYRLSLRYQYGLENTDKSHMLLIHNDVLFHSDIVGKFLEEDKDLFGIGSVGQCWNCPLFLENVCNSEQLKENITKLNYDDIIKYVDKRKETRTFYQTRNKINKEKPLPLPECRINEWCMLINVDLYKKEVLENKRVTPLGGYFQMDIGDLWFRQMVDNGYDFKNFNIKEHLTHAYFSIAGNGHSSLFDSNKYQMEEVEAKKYYEENLKDDNNNILNT